MAKEYFYAGEFGTIKLTREHYDAIVKRYPNILDITAELDQLDMQLMGKKDWWMKMHAMLNYRNNNAAPYNMTRPVAHRSTSTRDMTIADEMSTDWAKH